MKENDIEVARRALSLLASCCERADQLMSNKENQARGLRVLALLDAVLFGERARLLSKMLGDAQNARGESPSYAYSVKMLWR